MRMEWFIIKVLKFSLIDNVALSLGHSFSLIDVLNQNVVMRFTALNVLLIILEDEKNTFFFFFPNFLPWVFITGNSQSPKQNWLVALKHATLALQ